jgi:exodeoxyribonuclease V beta subunit
VKRLDPLAVPLEGTTLIEASAGTGKTWTLATLYLRLLLERRLQVGQILVVTYTNAATAELRDRVRSRLREAAAYFEQLEAGTAPDGDDGSAGEPLRTLGARSAAAGTLSQARKHLATALRSFDEAAIFTIHGFCQRILLENAFESRAPFEAELVTDEGPLCSEVVKDFWVRTLYDAPPLLVRRARARKKTPSVLGKLARKVLSHRDMRVLPEGAPRPGRDEVEAACAEWDGALAAAAAVWRASADEIAALLARPNVLSGRAFRTDWIRGWCATLAAFFATAADGVPGECEPLFRFTTAHLRRHTTPGAAPPEHAFFTACDRLQAARQRLDGLADAWFLGLDRELVDFVRDEVERRHEAADTQSFDDLLYRLRDALAGPGGKALGEQIRGRFRAALIDEFQDTDPVQYRIFRDVYEGSGEPLFLIGDPKQAIYGFRGADVFTYVDAKQDAGERAHTLQVNHRSAARLVEGVNVLFERARSPFVFDDIPFARVTAHDGDRAELVGAAAERPPLDVLFVRAPAGAKGRAAKEWANRGVPPLVAAEIARLLASDATIGGRAVHAGDVAVLCRTNRQAITMQKALRALGVPSVRQGDDSVFESEEAEEIERVLRAVAEPGDPRLLRAALATRLLGLDAAALAALQSDEAAWDDWATRLREWLETWTELGFMAAFRRLLDGRDTQARLLGFEDGERRLTNVLHVAELLQAASREAHRGPLALVDWLALMRSDASARAELASEAMQIRLESDAKAVQLVTIHRAKGLEYGVVYCPFTWDGTELQEDDRTWVRFHDAARELRLDLGSPERDEHLQQASLEAFAESLRLLYVAVTRARHRCTLVWGSINQVELAPLGYLLHQAPDGGDGPALVAATQARLAKLDEAAMLDELRALERAAGGAIGVREAALDGEATERVPPAAAGEDVLEPPPEPARTLDLAWRVSSFSGIAASGGRSHQAEEGLDHDATADVDASGQLAARRGTTIGLHELPPGARTGELLHAILEHADFQRRDPATLGARVRDATKRFGFDARWEPVLVQALAEALETPLAGPGSFALADVAPERRLNELQFLLPVEASFDKVRLARCFARHARGSYPDDYPARIERLGFAALEGFLGGFIDLVFEHDGRFWVVDYKSNFLGTRAEHYHPSLLPRVMSLHHYYLQYHLYVLAVHRYLAARLPGYRYERDFGGVLYLFLRGMSPQHAPGIGIFRDAPSAALIDDLARLLVGTEREAHP